MGRPRNPSNVADARGQFKHDPQRRRGPDPVNENPLSPHPDWFDKVQHEHWMHIANISAPGLLRASDWPTVVGICVLWGDIYDHNIESAVYKADLAAYNDAFTGRTSKAKDKVIAQGEPEKPKPLSMATYREYFSLCKECGLSPASRTRVGTSASKTRAEELAEYWNLDG
jgi:phage terminase small subunit